MEPPFEENGNAAPGGAARAIVLQEPGYHRTETVGPHAVEARPGARYLMLMVTVLLDCPSTTRDTLTLPLPARERGRATFT